MINLTQLLSVSHPATTSLRYNKEESPVIVWNLTSSCNLNCHFCYYDAKSHHSSAIDYRLAKRIARQIKQAKIKYLLLSGGEPLLYPEILTLIRGLTPFVQVGISTNGTLISQELAYELKRIGADYIGISLDGPRDIHNALRNSPTAFGKALDGLRYAQSAGLKTGIRLTLNSFNHKYLKDFFSFVEGLNVGRLCFYHLVYSGRASSVNNDLSHTQRRKAVELIIKYTTDWLKRRIPTQVLTVDNFSDAAILLEYIRKNKPQNYSSVLKLLRRQGGCPAGKKILSIDHQGLAHPCQFWQDLKLADLKKETLFNVLSNGKLFDSWRMRLKGRCAVCRYQDICGGCRVRAYQTYKDFWNQDPCCCLRDEEIKGEVNLLEHN